MKTRLANKIGRTTFIFAEYGSNYQPYSIPQQHKAIKVVCRKLKKEDRETLRQFAVYHKVPLKYRKVKGCLPDEFNMR